MHKIKLINILNRLTTRRQDAKIDALINYITSNINADDITDPDPSANSDKSPTSDSSYNEWQRSPTDEDDCNGKIEHCGRVTEIKTIIGSGWHDGIYYDDCMCCRSCMRGHDCTEPRPRNLKILRQLRS